MQTQKLLILVVTKQAAERNYLEESYRVLAQNAVQQKEYFREKYRCIRKHD